MKEYNEQQKFWAQDYASLYVEKNKEFDSVLGVEGWNKMLAKAEGVSSILECGCNTGRNIGFINEAKPEAAVR